MKIPNQRMTQDVETQNKRSIERSRTVPFCFHFWFYAGFHDQSDLPTVCDLWEIIFMLLTITVFNPD